MTGVASFLKRGAGRYFYKEETELTLPSGEVLRGERAYIYQFQPRGFCVFFAQEPERLFQQVELTAKDGGWQGRGEHVCGGDVYQSLYHFYDDGFRILHEVRGPRKNYRIDTVYTRK